MRLIVSVQTIPVSSRAEWLKYREADVTASVAGALFGVHPYVSAYSLYALKTGLTSEDAEETEAMRRGRLLEPVAVQILREERPNWTIRHNSGAGQVYLRDPDLRIGATPDVFVDCPERGRGVVQIKTVEPFLFRNVWQGGSSSNPVEIPLWIVIQAIVEARLADADFALVAPMAVSFGVTMPILEIPLHKGIWETLKGKVAEFWGQVDAGTPPSPDYAQDASLIASLYGESNGTSIDLTGDNRIMAILADRDALKARESDGNAAAKERKALDAEILHKMGQAAIATCGDGVTISAPTTHRKGYLVQPSSYRTVKVKGFAASEAAE